MEATNTERKQITNSAEKSGGGGGGGEQTTKHTGEQNLEVIQQILKG